MRTFVTTLGAAAAIGFAGLFQVATASAAPVPAPASIAGAHGQLAQHHTDSARWDADRRCMARSGSLGHFSPPMQIAGRWVCALN